MPSNPTAGRRLLACGVLAALVVGCGYGEVSPKAYAYAKSLYAVANRRASDRVEAVAERIAADEASGDLSAAEAGWLNAIVDDARAGAWDDAAKAARRLMEDQIR